MKEALIKKWLDEGLITKDQSEKMLLDLSDDRKEVSSDRFITAVSTIGAVLVGIGAILFIAANWKELSNIVKVGILSSATFIITTIGFVILSLKKNLPKVGASLIFLGCILFGATIFLIAQIYNVQANSHALVLLWMVGVIPFAYLFQLVPIAGLAMVLFYIWFTLFVTFSYSSIEKDISAIPVMYFGLSVLLFEFGAMHYIAPSLKKVARIIRIISLQVMMVFLFLATSRWVMDLYGTVKKFKFDKFAPELHLIVIYVLSIAAIFAAANLILRPLKSNTCRLEGILVLFLVGTTTLFYLSILHIGLILLLFNIGFIGAIILLFFIGYDRQDEKIIGIAMPYLTMYILARYFDLFWGVLPGALFFLIGGGILVGLAILLELKRRELKERFSGCEL